MFIRTKKYVMQSPIHGFIIGDLAYWIDDLVQYQFRIDDIIKNSGVCRPVMQRHRETINGRITSGWTKWTLCTGKKNFTIHLTHLKRESHE